MGDKIFVGRTLTAVNVDLFDWDYFQMLPHDVMFLAKEICPTSVLLEDGKECFRIVLLVLGRQFCCFSQPELCDKFWLDIGIYSV